MGLFGWGSSKSLGRVETIIGENSVLRGTYTAKSGLRVDGEIHGNVTAEDGIIIGEKGSVRGNLSGQSIVIGGKVKGNVTARQRVELQGTGQIIGNVATPVFSIEEGALFEGNCQMEESEKALDPLKPVDAKGH